MELNGELNNKLNDKLNNEVNNEVIDELNEKVNDEVIDELNEKEYIGGTKKQNGDKIKKFPKLFKITKTGKKTFWNIEINKKGKSYIITITHGYIDGKIVTEEPIIINVGKAGRSALEQAILEAKSRHNKKTHEGFGIENKKDNNDNSDNNNNDDSGEDDKDDKNDKNDKNDKSKSTKCIKIYPYLLKNFEKESGKINYPASAQIKFDGIRAIFGYSCGGSHPLFTSRTTIPLPNQFEHIKNEIIDNEFISKNIFLDGELYSDDITFEEVSGLARKKMLTTEDINKSRLVKYHVFDYLDTMSKQIYSERRKKLEQMFKNNKLKYLVIVPEFIVKSKEEVYDYLNKFTKEGYEGVVIRNLDFLYSQNRISDVQKLKKFQDAEYKIIDAVNGKGRAKDSIIFILETEDGKQFRAVYKGSIEQREKLYKSKDKIIGKMATVNFQELTNTGIPRFGVVKDIRNYILSL
jgi:DNA ligase-1